MGEILRVCRPRWVELLAGARYRSCRVVAFLAVIVLLSLADLYMTLVHLLHFGMLEANPFARQVMEYGSPAALIIWKLVTVATAVGIFFWTRRRWAAEWGAAFCCLVLCWLTGQWIAYNLQVSSMTTELTTVQQIGEPRWVSMTGED
jgi:hypothetical protein